jgi:cobalt-precorrin 5A hydrolase / precorrin-3B C17-methyltransferase
MLLESKTSKPHSAFPEAFFRVDRAILFSMQNLFQDFHPLAAIATTPLAAQKLEPFCQASSATLWLPGSLASDLPNPKFYQGSLKEHIASLWPTHRALIFCMASGAVVRLIAPLLEDKASDPAIAVIDQEGKFVISLCGGHQGGGDRLVQSIACQLGATPILTGASASLRLPGIDILGVPFGWKKGEGDWTEVSAAIARGEPIQVIQDAGSTLWQHHLPLNHPFVFEQDGEVRRRGDGEKSYELRITNQSKIQQVDCTGRGGPHVPQFWGNLAVPRPQNQNNPKSKIVQWHPRVLWIGMGCERGTSRELMEAAIAQVFEQYQLARGAIAGIATLDLKADEVGILELCRQYNWPLKTFSPERLRQVEVPTPSAVVEQEVGTPSVAEAAAILASQNSQLAIQPLIVRKQVFRSPIPNPSGAVTIAVAQSPIEYTGRTGQLWLVGTGPGSLEQMTPAAQTAIASAEAIIGYSLYLDLIESLRRPGQIIEASPITQEKQRAQRAIELAEWGLSVAVVSSGDCGIYGMAGLVFEELRARGWEGKTPQVQVFPGISALQAAASRVGAPLMHDFCAISLSDLLTPWDAIEKRLEAAAIGDFVIVLYNPRSQKRTQQIIVAREIFLKHRDRATPVAIVRSAYRPDEQITLTTLEEMLQFPIDMLTTAIIGNSSTYQTLDWMITPRGYQ